MLKHNVFDEIAGRLDSSVSYFHLPTCKLQCSYSYVSRYLDDTVERNEPPFQNCFE
ncbi:MULTISPECIES: hypothetical protein [unclassified Wolbachia]|uniref:hypothetical protein n=1 Tax=unclassified Wolbachia TaxID=2640676 RepID=UPI002231538A|nr:hypothetical protein [Wolbachia endosymbiont (group A) of Apoderus coryli]